jgi:hypothetical protein
MGDDLQAVAPAFVGMAHRIVWATVATVAPDNRPWTRVLHPIWDWDGASLVGWIATGPTPLKRAHLEHSPFVSVGYWAPDHDTCTADCRATWYTDDETCRRVWDRFLHGPAPVGYDPAIVPPWKDGPTSPAFAALRLEPSRLRVQPGAVMLRGEGRALVWRG